MDLSIDFAPGIRHSRGQPPTVNLSSRSPAAFLTLPRRPRPKWILHPIALRDSHDDHFQAAARSVRLDGDVILQQSEVLHWQAEGAGSMVDIRSVCSCTCQSCNPFQQGRRTKPVSSLSVGQCF